MNSYRPAMRDELVIGQVDDEVLVYDPVSDHTTVLNWSAAAVLELCDGERTVAEIIAAVGRAVPAAAGDLGTEIEDTIRSLAANGLLASAPPQLMSHPSKSMATRGIVINAAWGTWYPQASQRLERSLIHHGWVHEMKFWRNETINSFFNPEFPYTIKAAAVAQALRDGYTHILWMDCQLWVTGNPNILMQYIDHDGGLFFRSGANLAQTANDDDLRFANINRDEAELLPELWSCVFGFNVNTEQGNTFAHWFLDAARNGVFNTSRLHANGSRDERYLFARQDQTAATIAYHKAGYNIMKEPGDLLGDYSKDSDKLIYRRRM